MFGKKMEMEYTQSKAQSKLIAWELFLSQSKLIKNLIKYLKPVAFAAACIYCAITPAKSIFNGKYDLISSILLTILVQMPLCALIFYTLLKLALHAPKRAIDKAIERMPEEQWGIRKFTIAPDGIRSVSPGRELKVSLERINSITETEHAIALSDQQNPVFLLPKSAFALSEVAAAFDQMKTEQ